AIDADGERRVEARRLRGLVGIRYRLPAHQLDQLDRGVAVGMQREEDAAGARDRDVAGRVVEVGDHLEGGDGQGGRGGAVLEPHPAASGEEQQGDEGRAPHGPPVYHGLYSARSASSTGSRATRRADRSPAGTLTRNAASAAAGMLPAAKWESISQPSWSVELTRTQRSASTSPIASPPASPS